MTTIEAQHEVIVNLILERDKAKAKYRAEVINRKRECFKLHREIKDLSCQLDTIRAVFKKEKAEEWRPCTTLAETVARILKERDEVREQIKELIYILEKIKEEAK